MKNSPTFSELTDEHLFLLVKALNRIASEELYHRHWRSLYDTAVKALQSKPRAEDIVQDIFISLYIKRGNLEITTSLKAYLCQALRFRILNEFRSGYTRKKYADEIFFMQSGKNDFVIPVETKEVRDKLYYTVKQLPEKCREVFLLSREKNLSYRDISADLGISVSTVEKHMIKALKLIRAGMN